MDDSSNLPNQPAAAPISARASPASTAIYEGLSTRERAWVLSVSAAIALLALAFAGYFSLQATADIRLVPADTQVFEKQIDKTGDAALRFALTERAINTVALLKLVSNKQSIILAAYSGAFALFAIGFALFLIGADGSFKVMAQSTPATKVAITGTTPGLLCFLIAGWLIAQGVQHRSEMNLPPISTFQTSVSTVDPAQEQNPCEERDPITRKCRTAPAVKGQGK